MNPAGSVDVRFIVQNKVLRVFDRVIQVAVLVLLASLVVGLVLNMTWESARWIIGALLFALAFLAVQVVDKGIVATVRGRRHKR